MKRQILLAALVLLLPGCQKKTPELARKVPAAEDNEASAISSVKKIVTAQFNYSKGSGGEHAITLVALRSVGLIDSALESG